MLFLTGYAHLDSQWRWDYPVMIEEFLKNTLEKNFQLLERYPSYRFNFSGALRYQMIKEYYPDHYRQLKRWIRESRWHPAGTSFEETDVIIPSIESVIRNIFYGEQFFSSEYQRSSTDFLLPDSFGFPENLPTILAHCSISGFSTQKLVWNPVKEIPFSIGLWEGPDGSRIPAALDAGAYETKVRRGFFQKYIWKKRISANRELFRIPKDFRYYGTGDRGGSPDENSVARLSRLVEARVPFVRAESSDRFFTTLTKNEVLKLPKYRGDLLLTNHSAGILTSGAIMKRWNTMNENLAYAAETAAAGSFWITGAPVPAEKLKTGWMRLISTQMHDIITGTAAPHALALSCNDEAAALNTFRSVLHDAAFSIASRMDIRKGVENLLVFNPAGVARKSIVPIAVDGVSYSSRIRITDAGGNSLPLQILDQKENKATILTALTLPPAGWSMIYAQESTKLKHPAIPQPATIKKIKDGLQMENRLLRLKISSQGAITSIFLKEENTDGKEFLAAPIHLELLKERPSAYPAWNMDWKDRKKEGIPISQSGARLLITEQGPLRVSVTAEFSLGKSSRVIRTVSLTSVGDEQLISINERISWQERGVSLKEVFPFALKDPAVIGNWESSRVEWGLNSPAQFEFPTRNWIETVDSSREYGISILTSDKHGFDRPAEDILRLTLLYTPAIPMGTQMFQDQATQDWGRHSISFSIYPHHGDFRDSRTEEISMTNRHRVHTFQCEGKKHLSADLKPVSSPMSLYKLNTAQAAVTCCKPAERGDSASLIIRLVETHGRDLEKGILTFGTRILEAFEVNGLEETIGPVDTFGRNIEFSLIRNGIRAFRVRLAAAPGRNQTARLKTVPVGIPCNSRMISEQGDSAAGSGPLFPKELIPHELTIGLIPFRLEHEGIFNAVSCGGELLTIPDISPGVRADSLYLLGAADERVEAVFGYPENKSAETRLVIPQMTGFIGQYDTRIWDHPPVKPVDYQWKKRCLRVDPGYLEQERLEWFATHMHGAGSDFPYYFGYLYRFRIDLPPFVGSIQLPQDLRVKIFAITACEESLKLSRSSIINDPFDFI